MIFFVKINFCFEFFVSIEACEIESLIGLFKKFETSFINFNKFLSYLIWLLQKDIKRTKKILRTCMMSYKNE